MFPRLVYSFVYPGSGKSTFTRKLSEYFRTCFTSADELMVELFRHPKFVDAERDIVIKEMRFRVEEILLGKNNVVLDNNSNTLLRRENIELFANNNKVSCLGIWIVLDIDKCRQRALGERQDLSGFRYLLSEDQFIKAVENFQEPKSSENVLCIPGDEDFSKQLEVFKKYLAS